MPVLPARQLAAHQLWPRTPCLRPQLELHPDHIRAYSFLAAFRLRSSLYGEITSRAKSGSLTASNNLYVPRHRKSWSSSTITYGATHLSTRRPRPPLVGPPIRVGQAHIAFHHQTWPALKVLL